MRHLVQAESWTEYAQLLEDSAKTYHNEILSEKFKNDHDGYLLALGAYNALELARTLPDRKIDEGTEAIKKLEEYGRKS